MRTKPVKRGEYTSSQYKSILGQISDVIEETFYLAYPPDRISETLSRMLPEERKTVRKSETPSRISSPAELCQHLPIILGARYPAGAAPPIRLQEPIAATQFR